MIEIPPKFAGRALVGPVPAGERQTKAKATEDWSGARGLAEDVRRYGAWMRAEAEKRIGHLYPNVRITEAMVKDRPDLKKYAGRALTVIAWLWARTVASPNPAMAGAQVPLVGSFYVSQRKGKEAWVEPVVRGTHFDFIVRAGVPKDPEAVSQGTRTARGANFRCILTESPIGDDYVKNEARQFLATVGLISPVSLFHSGLT